MELTFSKQPFGRRLKSMLKVDFRRMFRSKLFYILLACALLIPILMTAMLTMMDGTVSVDPQTGAETVLHGPESTWQSLGTLPTVEATAGMDVMAMCNINMMFMLVSVFICLFVSDDFRSGYAKNLFAVRVKRGDYVVSKTLAGWLCGALMLVLYAAGAVLGGGICGLSFGLEGMTAGNLAMCLLAKVLLMPVFIAIFLLISVAAKQKAWLAICGSLGGGMLLFMTVGIVTPLNATVLHVLLCLAGGLVFAVGLGFGSRAVLQKSSLV